MRKHASRIALLEFRVVQPFELLLYLRKCAPRTVLDMLSLVQEGSTLLNYPEPLLYMRKHASRIEFRVVQPF